MARIEDKELEVLRDIIAAKSTACSSCPCRCKEPGGACNRSLALDRLKDKLRTASGVRTF